MRRREEVERSHGEADARALAPTSTCRGSRRGMGQYVPNDAIDK